jgi:hypothetical protein
MRATMRVRRRSFLAVAGALGAAVAVLPALAGSEATPTIDAVTSRPACTPKNTTTGSRR